MLASAGIINVVAETLQQQQHIPVVLDPVMVATSGAQLLPQAAIKSLCEKLLPLTTILTPNIPEAKLLLEESGKSTGDVKGIDDLIDLARAVQSLGPKYVLVKGGHLPLDGSGTTGKRVVANVLCDKGETFVFESSYLDTRNTHGTGCSLAYIGQSEDWLALQVALLPCLLGYGMIGQRLCNDPTTVKEGNQYFEWIENYVAEDFTEAVRVGSGRLYPDFRVGITRLD
ncbi:MAG: hypothetical protein Q9157_008405 [Trypethelium eluteriae]